VGGALGALTTAAGFCDGTFGAVVDYVEQTCSEQDKQSDSYLFVWGLLQGAVEQCSTVLQSSIDEGARGNQRRRPRAAWTINTRSLPL
jgi:hypothetical protein